MTGTVCFKKINPISYIGKLENLQDLEIDFLEIDMIVKKDKKFSRSFKKPCLEYGWLSID